MIGVQSHGKSCSKNRSGWRKGIRKGFDRLGDVSCQECFQKDREIDVLKAKVVELRNKLNYREKRAKIQGAFGSSTPSAQKPLKSNSLEVNQESKGGAKIGHKGRGRSVAKHGDQVVFHDKPEKCPDCHVVLCERDTRERTIVDAAPVKAKRVLHQYKRGQCPCCFKVYSEKLPVLPKCLYGNQLLAQAAVMHYLHGVPIGRILTLLGPEVTEGGLIEAFHRLGKLCNQVVPQLIVDYRNSWIKQADETGWRTDGKGGYAWVFCSADTSIFRFGENRSAQVAHRILGNDPLKGYLVVDRYGGYNRINCRIQYCFAHLLRTVEDLGEEFYDNTEVTQYVDELCAFLGEAMRLRAMPITDEKYYVRAKEIKMGIQRVSLKSAKHLGIQAIQSIFIENELRLYHWVEDRRVPAENNRSEREIRPSVVARKSSYGSQSKKGAETRSAIMTVLYTIKKRTIDKPPEIWLKEALDSIVENPHLSLVALFQSLTSSHPLSTPGH